MWVLGLYLWLSATRENLTTLLLNYDSKTAKMLGDRVQGVVKGFHPLLTPSIKEMNRQVIHFDTKVDSVKRGKSGGTAEAGLNSKILNQTADSPTLGRSLTVHYVLLSEFAFWPDLCYRSLESA
jgi:hypothetical protein